VVDMWEVRGGVAASYNRRRMTAKGSAVSDSSNQGHFLQHETEKPGVLKARQERRDRLLAHTAMRRVMRTVRAVGRMLTNLYDPGSSSIAQRGRNRGLMLCHPRARRTSERAGLGAPELMTRLLGITPKRKDARPLSQACASAQPTSRSGARCEARVT